MDMHCNDAMPLIGSYLDGELTEVRATLLRKHLIDCHACRNSTQDGKTLKRWFAPLREAADDRTSTLALVPPTGFAARVARRAFAGDTGLHENQFTLPRRREANVFQFVLSATAIAASLTFILAIGIRMQTRPTGANVSALTDGMPQSFEQVVKKLDALNAPKSVDADAAGLAATKRQRTDERTRDNDDRKRNDERTRNDEQ